MSPPSGSAVFDPEPPQLASEPVSASCATPQAADARFAEDAFCDPGDVSVVVAEDDDDEDSGPAGTGEPVVQVVAPEVLEEQPLAAIVEVSCSVADCASLLEPLAAVVTQFVAPAAPAAQASETITIAAIALTIRLAITLRPLDREELALLERSARPGVGGRAGGGGPPAEGRRHAGERGHREERVFAGGGCR